MVPWGADCLSRSQDSDFFRERIHVLIGINLQRLQLAAPHASLNFEGQRIRDYGGFVDAENHYSRATYVFLLSLAG
jgi:hypothetical protein